MKNIVTEIKKSIDGFNRIEDIAAERIDKLENKTEKLSKIQPKEKRDGKD